MDHVENPMVIDSLWHHNKHDYQFESEERHVCCMCNDDIEDEGYQADNDFFCKHCLLDKFVVHCWEEVS